MDGVKHGMTQVTCKMNEEGVGIVLVIWLMHLNTFWGSFRCI